MKRGIILSFILLLSISLISSIEIKMNSEYAQGETLITKISGTFLSSIEKENIYFYRNYVHVPIDYSIIKMNDEYYVYAILPESQNNYSIVIKDVFYRQGTRILNNETVRNFTILNTSADFNINPGALTTKNDFSIKIQNLQPYKISISISSQNITNGIDSSFFSILNSQSNLELKPGEIKVINFNLKNISNSTLKTISLKSLNTKYEVPIYIISNNTEEIPKREFEILPKFFNISSSIKSNKTKTLLVNNTGKIIIKNISFSLSPSLKEILTLSKYTIDKLKENSDMRIEVLFFSDKEGVFEGQIKAKTENSEIVNIPIYANFVKDYIPSTEENDTDIYSNNTIPGGKEIDDENNFYSTKKIIGWVLVLIILIGLLWFYSKKYKGAKRDINLLKIGKGKD